MENGNYIEVENEAGTLNTETLPFEEVTEGDVSNCSSNRRARYKKQRVAGSYEYCTEKDQNKKRPYFTKFFPNSLILIGFKGDMIFDYKPVYLQSNLN